MSWRCRAALTCVCNGGYLGAVIRAAAKSAISQEATDKNINTAAHAVLNFYVYLSLSAADQTEGYAALRWQNTVAPLIVLSRRIARL